MTYFAAYQDQNCVHVTNENGNKHVSPVFECYESNTPEGYPFSCVTCVAARKLSNNGIIKVSERDTYTGELVASLGMI